MFKFITIFLIFVALSKVGAFERNPVISNQNESSTGLSEPRIFIIAKMTKEVLKLKLYALKAALEEAANINEYKKEIRSIVKVSLQNINDQLQELDGQIKNATNQAKSEGVNIRSCLRREKLSKWSKIRSGRLLQCKKTFSFDVLKLKLAELSYVKVKAAAIIPSCLVLHPISNKKLKTCIQTKIDSTYSTANLIKSNIDEDASKIYDKANNCIEDNLGNLDLDIETISDEFGECVKNKLKEN
ncbi:uncharacterized protein LOC123684923 [Harmonia axyridis]|uniref:uncharacterized protein LOC123684923 n=1 Tax=Harmonia axyridis TaxID=115357 RepID=UPI001E277267|nr:uncharacterized protein LOC123684923 [Harmonia axyridis]